MCFCGRGQHRCAGTNSIFFYPHASVRRQSWSPPHGSLDLDETKRSVPWRALHSPLEKIEKYGNCSSTSVRALVVRAPTAQLRWNKFHTFLPTCVGAPTLVASTVRIARSRRDEAIRALESTQLSPWKNRKVWKLFQRKCARARGAGAGLALTCHFLGWVPVRVSSCQFVSVGSDSLRGRCTFVSGSCHIRLSSEILSPAPVRSSSEKSQSVRGYSVR